MLCTFARGRFSIASGSGVTDRSDRTIRLTKLECMRRSVNQTHAMSNTEHVDANLLMTEKVTGIHLRAAQALKTSVPQAAHGRSGPAQEKLIGLTRSENFCTPEEESEAGVASFSIFLVHARVHSNIRSLLA